MNEQRPRVMVAGATGYIGGGVLQVLHQRGFWVRALCRDPSRLSNPNECDEIFVGQATQPETLKGLCEGIEVVFSSIGIRSFKRKPSIWEVDYQGNLNLLQAAQQAGVRHFIFVAVVRGEAMARLSPIAAARQKVAQAVIQSGMDYTIFAPTGFFNDMAEIFHAAQQRGVIRLFGDGSGKINPLSALDFGEEVVKAIRSPELRNKVKAVGGGETFTHRQIAELAFQVLGKEPRIKTLPAWRVGLIAALLRPFNTNAYAMFKFFEFIARTPDATGEAIGRRRLENFFRNLAQGLPLAEADRRALGHEQTDWDGMGVAKDGVMMTQEVAAKLRQRFERFAELRAQYGTEQALAILSDGQAEHQRQLMSPFISGVSLAEGFSRSIPIFEQLGMEMEVVDISNQGKDAVLEIQRVCPYMALASEFGLPTPCQITCDLEVQAINQAFPDMNGRILSKLACGDCVCVFKYERDLTSSPA
jgi:uncharacterized protein YbjT (DUF2867 family)